MDMMWIWDILSWPVTPFAELGVIIALLIKNDKYKARIRELERERGRMSSIAAAAYENPAGWPGEGTAEKRGKELVEKTAEKTVEETAEGTAAKTVDETVEGTVKETAEKTVEKAMQKTMQKAMYSDEERSVPNYQEYAGEQPETKRPVPTKAQPRHSLPGRHNLGMFALILGVIFIVLAGLIFATTAWHILPDICKVVLVLGCSILFFGVSFLAEKRIHVHKTSNGFYILGSIFLFLTILAAAYFQLLGAEFILNGRNRWKVLWVGSVVTILAFWAGIKRFDDKIYTQACLWEISVSLFFMAKTFSFGWDGFAAAMMIYSAMLVCGREYLEYYGVKSPEKKGFRRILSNGFGFFAPVHFWLFAALTALRGLSAVWIMTGSCAIGYDGDFFENFWFFSFTTSGMVSMAAWLIGAYVLVHRKQTETYRYLYSLTALEAILYTAGWITDDSVWRMAVINLALVLIQIVRYHKRKMEMELHEPFWDICGSGSLLFSLIIMHISGNDNWRFVYLLAASCYCVQYRKVESIKRQALSFSACFAAAAFWLQPFGLWPQVLRLEMSLLPAAWILWTMGLIWDHNPEIRILQNLGYMACLVLLFKDAVFSGLVVDSLLLEGICLGIFVRAQIKDRVWWGRISGGMSLVVALFMTRAFWLSISWWVYLLAAGIGLVVLAGVMEKKEKDSGR